MKLSTKIRNIEKNRILKFRKYENFTELGKKLLNISSCYLSRNNTKTTSPYTDDTCYLVVDSYLNLVIKKKRAKMYYFLKFYQI